ncbi:MAG: phosphoribosyltransferase family protein [Patescibacteria group bacterium]
MSVFSLLKKLCLDFLYPKSTRVIKLESLSTERLQELLPPSELNIENVSALFNYSHPLVKEIIWQIKYAGNRVLADKMGEILYDTIVSELEERNIFEKEKRKTVLIPVPISDKRRFERGWNQAELLVEAAKSRDTSNHLKYLPRQLIKIRHTESQTRTASKSERKENLKDSMKVIYPPSIKDRFIILVDDVITTGSTFTEAKRALKDAGAKRVLCFAVAH